MWLYFVAMLALPVAAMAQPIGILSEDVAPVMQNGAASTGLTVSASEPSLGTGAAVPVSTLIPMTSVAVAPPSPTLPVIDNYFVPGLSVELPAAGVSSTLREMAMNQAAKDGLVRLLGSAEPPLEPSVQARVVASAADPMGLVSEFRIAEEVLNPSYTLTVDLTYRPEKVAGLMSAQLAPVPVSGSVSVSPEAVAVGMAKLVVRVGGNAGAQDRVLRTLKGAGIPAVYSRLTRDGAEIAVGRGDSGSIMALLRGKNMVAEIAGDGAVEVKF